MEKALVALSFDDGRLDNIRVAKEILLPRNISATFNITTGYVDGTCPKILLKTEQDAMSIDDVCWLNKKSAFEIAMHGDRHQNTEEDISVGREKLIDWLGLPSDYQFGFASPSSGLEVSVIKQSKSELFNKQISYFRLGQRLGRGIKKVALLNRIDQKLKIGRFYNFYQPKAFSIENEDSLMCKTDNRVLYSVIVYRHTTCEELFRLIDKCIRKKLAVVFMFHSILDNAEEVTTYNHDNDLLYLWNTSRFVQLCDYISKKRDNGLLEIVTTGEMYQLLKR